MIKMTYQQATGFEFTRAMQKLTSVPMDRKAAFTVKKIADALNRQRNRISEEYQRDLVDKYAKRDEQGKIVLAEGRTDSFDVADDQVEAFRQAQEEFGKREFTIERAKLSEEIFNGAKFSAAELTVLEPLYEEASELSAEGSESKVVSING